jgi:transcriptional regulator with XRE-family HTH domain
VERVGPTLQEVLAQNIRRVRLDEGLRQDELATRARAAGLAWTSVTVATIETGQRAIAAEELLLLPMVFDRPLEDFIQTDASMIRVSDTAAVLTQTLSAVVSGEWDTRPLPTRRAIPYLEGDRDERILAAIKKFHLPENLLSYFLIAEARKGEAERKAAQTLKTDAADVAAASLAIFGRDLTAERDSRAGREVQEGQDPRAVRGHITRNLLTNIEGALKDPSHLTPAKIDDQAAQERVGVAHSVLKEAPLTVDPSAVFRMLARTYVAMEEKLQSGEEWPAEHRVRIKKTSRGGGSK